MQNSVRWGVHCAGMKPIGDTGQYEPVHGLQDFGRTITIDNTPIFEIGQFAIYELLEGTPDVEVTMEKVLDGYPTLWHLATQGAPNGSLFGKINQKTIIGSAIYPDTNDSASGVPLSLIEMSGMYASDYSLTNSVDSEFRESLTLVGNNFRFSPGNTSVYGTFASTVFDNTDEPLSLPLSGGVQQREDFIIGDIANSCRVPTMLPGVTSSGTIRVDGEGNPSIILQTVTINASLAREDAFALGKKTPYDRPVTLPVEINSEFTFLSLSGEVMNFTEEGYLGNGSNLKNEYIKIVLREGLTVDLGGRNKLNNISVTDGSAGGGAQSITVSYTTYNELTITHPNDPDGF